MNDDVRLILGDCLTVMGGLESESVDAIVTDPPSGIGFMGKDWDRNKGGRSDWVAWLMPHMAETYRVAKPGTYALVWALPRTSHWTATAVEDAGWVICDRVTHLFGNGWPKARSYLKPAAEDWWLASKAGKKTSPLQIDACRIGNNNLDGVGRWPANVVLDRESAAMLDGQSGIRRSSYSNRMKADAKMAERKPSNGKRSSYGAGMETKPVGRIYTDKGGASRFFFIDKASSRDRGENNNHPTVKSTDLMRWLCRLVTSPGGLILDPFAGTASTGKAAIMEGFRFLGIESDPEYHRIGLRRLGIGGVVPGGQKSMFDE